ncbi:unnamed protein product, partial [marine sediment metagenome]
TSDGQKMSKSLGNVVNPFDLVKKYGTDAVRYYLLKEIPPFKDGDFTIKHFEEVYNADLANGIGNLAQRLSKIAEISKFKVQNLKLQFKIQNYEIYNDFLEKYKFNEVLIWIWQRIKELDKIIDEDKPWKLIADLKEKKLYGFFDFSIKRILEIAFWLKPFLPETSERIEKIFTSAKIQAPKKPLFPRL